MEVMGFDDELTRRTGLTRSDYQVACSDATDFEAEDLAYDLFWEVYRPQIRRGEEWGDHFAEMDEEDQSKVIQRLALPDLQDLKDAFLERLTQFDATFSSVAEAGHSDSIRLEKSRAMKLDMAACLPAARALALKSAHGVYSEEARACLRRARHAGQMLGVETHTIQEYPGFDLDEKPPRLPLGQRYIYWERPDGRKWAPEYWLATARARQGIVLLELFYALRHEGPGDEVLHLLTSSLQCLGDAVSHALRSFPEQTPGWQLAALAQYVSHGRFTPPYLRMDPEAEDLDGDRDHYFQLDILGSTSAIMP